MSLNPQLGSAPITAGPLTAIDRANISLPYASGGGGGGGGGPVLTVSTINMNPVGQINMRNAGSGGTAGFNGAILAFDKDPAPNVTVWMGYNTDNDAIQITQESGQGLASAALHVDSILCSSINGVAPGGSLFQSTFSAVPCPGNTSTVLMEMPAGQFAFQGLISGGGATSMLSGNVNVIVEQSGPNYWGQISQIVGSQPAGSFPSQMVINQGDSALSTIKLIVAATGATAGAFTGVVSKLY